MSKHQQPAPPMDADIGDFATWLMLVAANEPGDASCEVLSERHRENRICPYCVVGFLLEREIARGHGEEVAPLVNFQTVN